LESPDDVGAQSAIQNYEKRRHHRVRRVQFGLDSLQRLVGDGHPSVQGLREMGMRFISRVGPLRQLLIRQAISPQ
jgi:2-octaprenyl-6-methoxyphenol hydroxylase/2-octaprenylphenol hydroxylase